MASSTSSVVRVRAPPSRPAREATSRLKRSQPFGTSAARDETIIHPRRQPPSSRSLEALLLLAVPPVHGAGRRECTCDPSCGALSTLRPVGVARRARNPEVRARARRVPWRVHRWISRPPPPPARRGRRWRSCEQPQRGASRRLGKYNGEGRRRGNGRGQRGGRGARGISDKILPERGKGPPGISLFPATGRAQTRRGAAGRRARRIAAREDHRNDRRGDDSAREEARRATETRARGARTGRGGETHPREALHGERSGSNLPA